LELDWYRRIDFDGTSCSVRGNDLCPCPLWIQSVPLGTMYYEGNTFPGLSTTFNKDYAIWSGIVIYTRNPVHLQENPKFRCAPLLWPPKIQKLYRYSSISPTRWKLLRFNNQSCISIVRVSILWMTWCYITMVGSEIPLGAR